MSASDPQPMTPPFGVPQGPSLSTSQLLASYLAGACEGSSPDAYIEGHLLMGSDHYVAIRLDVAMVVRAEVHEAAESVHAALCRALQDADLELVERDSVLAGALAAEMAVPRGFEWDLWAQDADRALVELTHRAAGDIPSLRDANLARRLAESEMDAMLRQMERGL